MPAPKGISEKAFKSLKEQLARKPGVKNEFALATHILKKRKRKGA